MAYWQCEMKKDNSSLRSHSIQAEHRLEALQKWLRDYEREFEMEDWNRLEVQPE